MSDNFAIRRSENGCWYGTFLPLLDLGFINAFSCRMHGDSDIVTGELNLALHIGDNNAKVIENRKRFAEAVGVTADKFTTCAQVHGDKVVTVTSTQIGSGAYSYEQSIPEVDALTSALPKVPLLLFYADCVPVLLADTKTGAVGLAHAGWRGSVENISAKTLLTMQKNHGTNPCDVVAAIGPSIGSCCYEVDDVVYNKASQYDVCFSKSAANKYSLDLWLLNRLQLSQAGVLDENIYCAEVCTSDNKEIFFSYRAENSVTGRMGVTICSR